MLSIYLQFPLKIMNQELQEQLVELAYNYIHTLSE